MTADPVIAKGLAGIVVDNTATSLVDGEAGRLYYRGYAIEQLVEEPFAAVAHLLVFGELPTAPRLAEFEAFLWSRAGFPPIRQPSWIGWQRRVPIQWRCCRQPCR